MSISEEDIDNLLQSDKFIQAVAGVINRIKEPSDELKRSMGGIYRAFGDKFSEYERYKDFY